MSSTTGHDDNEERELIDVDYLPTTFVDATTRFIGKTIINCINSLIKLRQINSTLEDFLENELHSKLAFELADFADPGARSIIQVHLKETVAALSETYHRKMREGKKKRSSSSYSSSSSSDEDAPAAKQKKRKVIVEFPLCNKYLKDSDLSKNHRIMGGFQRQVANHTDGFCEVTGFLPQMEGMLALKSACERTKELIYSLWLILYNKRKDIDIIEHTDDATLILPSKFPPLPGIPRESELPDIMGESIKLASATLETVNQMINFTRDANFNPHCNWIVVQNLINQRAISSGVGCDFADRNNLREIKTAADDVFSRIKAAPGTSNRFLGWPSHQSSVLQDRGGKGQATAFSRSFNRRDQTGGGSSVGGSRQYPDRKERGGTGTAAAAPSRATASD